MARECDSTRLVSTEKHSVLREYCKWIEVNLHVFGCLVSIASNTDVYSIRQSALAYIDVISTTVSSSSQGGMPTVLSLIHISEPTRPY